MPIWRVLRPRVTLGTVELGQIYIGKAGTINQDGSMKQQGLSKRLVMKQDGVYRNEFFPTVMAERGLDALHIEWFVTFNASDHIPPFLAEAELLAAFYACHGRLPALNQSA